MWPFTRKKQAPVATITDDSIWLSSVDRVLGVVTAATAALEAQSHVLIVVHTPDLLPDVVDAATRASLPIDALDSPLTPSQVLDRLRRENGWTVFIALAKMLVLAPTDGQVRALTNPVPETCVSMIVAERFPLASADNALIAFATLLRARKVEFHGSFDDPVFRLFRSEQTIKTLRLLGMKEGERIQHPMLTRSISRAQKKVAKECQDVSNVESWIRKRLERASPP